MFTDRNGNEIKHVTFVHNPTEIHGYRVTLDNLEELAKWCKGSVEREPDRVYILVPIRNPLKDRWAKAFVGDWLLKHPGGQIHTFKTRDLKNYTPKE